ncbi:MAG: hypothetical protein R3E32_25080 [Chitinophagales bacterium]
MLLEAVISKKEMFMKEATQELEKFFQVAVVYQKKTNKPARMMSCIVDEAWHQILKDELGYQNFCNNVVGQVLPHNQVKGFGVIGWTSIYEDMFGQLPEIWFRNSDGDLDSNTYQKYLKTGIIEAAWDCTPYNPDFPK